MRILDGSAGFSVPLTEQEAKDFLSNSKFNVHIATLDEKGHPNLHPAWYYFEQGQDLCCGKKTPLICPICQITFLDQVISGK